MKINPTTVTWVPPTQYVDGSAFGAVDFAGYDFGFRPKGVGDYVPTVSVPLTYGDTTYDITALDLPANTDLEFVMRTVATNGLSSDWTSPVEIRFDIRKPNPPTGFSVA